LFFVSWCLSRPVASVAHPCDDRGCVRIHLLKVYEARLEAFKARSPRATLSAPRSWSDLAGRASSRWQSGSFFAYCPIQIILAVGENRSQHF
jgi:hypothetical protein